MRSPLNADPFTAWREADTRARAAEACVLNASLTALDGRGQPPTVAERARAKALREEADQLLERAFATVSGRESTRRDAGTVMHARAHMPHPQAERNS